MKRIALLCLIAFAHGCCCPTEKTKEDIVRELIVDEKHRPILFPFEKVSKVSPPNATHIKNLVYN
jgi:hypothetical protein